MSCNTAFANLGLEVGEDKLREQSAQFGFNQRHLPDLGGAASRFPDEVDDAQLALSAIGQFDVAASPLQMAMVSAAIANDGVLMNPYLVSMVQAPDLKPLETHKPEALSTPLTPEHAAELQEMMVVVVESGTGTNAQISGVEVGGKTGTAQSDPTRKPFAWFTSFAPRGRPEGRGGGDRRGRRHPPRRHRRRPGGGPDRQGRDAGSARRPRRHPFGNRRQIAAFEPDSLQSVGSFLGSRASRTRAVRAEPAHGPEWLGVGGGK